MNSSTLYIVVLLVKTCIIFVLLVGIWIRDKLDYFCVGMLVKIKRMKN